jgi:ABC-type transport system involved in multi-copper enzyme maturation permease subunit
MSVQTGEALPSAPASQRAVDRARHRIALWRADPNPIWIRELRQSARLTRTPLILMAITVFVTLIIAAVGGVLSDQVASDKVGLTTFNTFFSLAFFLVAWVGPALAANAIAAEREGRTWEAVLLTGLRPQVIARGKFLAAFTAIGTYIVMLAPVGALCFLFGGVQAIEVAIAFVYLFVFALLSVAFGLALSSKMGSSRGAIVLTLLLSVPLSMFVYGLGGPAMSAAVHQLWPGVPEGPPVWLPMAYVRGSFGFEYLVLLFGLPGILVVLPAWFFYETTVANLSGTNDDRSTGMKQWFVVAGVLLTATAVLGVLSVRPVDADEVGVIALVLLAVFASFCAFVFVGEPVGPSRRVQMDWERRGAGRVRRFLGPGLVGAAELQLLVLVPAFALTTFVAAYVLLSIPSGPPYYGAPPSPDGVIRFGAYAGSFYIFVVGVAAFLRARAAAPMPARVLLFVVIAAVAVIPWIVAAIGGAIVQSSEAMAVASPSPFYAFVLLERARPDVVYEAGWAMTGVWTILGFVLLVSAGRKSRAIVASFEATLAEAERRLAEEDAALEAALLAEAGAAAALAEHDPAMGHAEPSQAEAPIEPAPEATRAPEPRSDDPAEPGERG